MADAVRAAPLDRLPDALLAEGLAGMDGDVEVLPLDVVERIDMLLGRDTALLAGEVEPHDAPLRKSTASSAISSERFMFRMAQMIRPNSTPKSFFPRSRPRSTALTTSSQCRPLSVWKTGAKRVST